MKSASVLLFAASAAAEYRHHSSSSSKLGYTTVYPGHGKEPVTVTAQYQPVPTYVNGKWSSYEAMSTVITDGYGKKVCVTKADQDVTVYHTKGTITHTATSEGYAKPTDYYGGKGSHSNNTYPTTKVWHELYEEIHEVPYKHVGPHAIPGYPGNPKYNGDKDEQYVKVKKYTGGKWTTYDHTYTYSAPEPSVTTYDAPGTYIIPAKDLTVNYPTTMPVEHTYKAEANKPCIYGGETTDVTKPTTITAAYAAYETDGTVTKTVVHTKTITCSKPGKYTIKEPTTTVYPHDTIVTYPAVTTYAPGVYHHPAETVTITKSKQPYTCKYDQTSTYPDPSSTPVYPVYPVSTPDYSTTTKDSYPEYPEETKDAYPEYPEETPKASKDAYPQYPKGTPSANKEYPQYPKGTPKADNEYPQYPKGTPSATKNAYPQYPAETPEGSKEYPQYPKGTPSANKEYPQYPKGTPSATKNAYPQYPAETPKGSKGSYPQYPKGTPTANKEYPQYPKGTPKGSKDAYPQYPKGTPKANKEYPQSPKGTPSKNSYPTPSPVYKEPAKNYGNASPGYVKRAGFAERRAAAVQV